MAVAFANSVSEWLGSRYIKVSYDWLVACLEWVEQKHPGVNLQQVQKEVYQQWLLSDLEEIGASSLPHALNASEKGVLPGVYHFQVLHITDISKSAYSQLQKLQGKENDNATVTAAPKEWVPQWELNSSRMLMIAMSDGMRRVRAIEYHRVTSLVPDLPPGTKIQISGPVTFRLGVLLLSETNVKVLGGDVASLLESNSQIQVLSRLIGRPVAPTHFNAERLNTQVVARELHNMPGHQTHSDGEINMGHDGESRAVQLNGGARGQDSGMGSSRNLTGMENGSVVPVSCPSEGVLEENMDAYFPLLEDSSWADVDFEPNDGEDGMLEEYIDEDILNEHLNFQQLADDLKLSCNSLHPPKNSVGRIVRVDYENSQPFTYLSSNIAEGVVGQKTVMIKAFITTLTSRLHPHPTHGWELEAKINDGTSSMDVTLSDNLIKGLIGFSADEVASVMKNKMQATKYAKEKISKALQHCQKCLQGMNCLMTVVFDSQLPKPCVTQCHPVERDHISQLMSRVSKAYLGGKF